MKQWQTRDGRPAIIARVVGLLIAMVLLVGAVQPAGYVVMVALAVYAMFGVRQSVEALILLGFCIIVNKSVMPITQVYAFRWLVLFAAFGRVLWDTVFCGARFPRVLMPLSVFAATAFVFALLVSPMPVVSVFKILSFIVGVATILTGFFRTRHLRGYWLAWVITLGAFIVLASVPLYVLRAGYVKNGTGFQGILTHPQTWGTVVAMFAALFSGLVVFVGDRRWWMMVTAGFAWLGVYTSLSRTAMLAVLLGLVISGVVAVFSRRRDWSVQVFRAASSKPVVLGALGLVVLAVLSWSTLVSTTTGFLLKDDAVEGGAVTDALMSSRENLIQRSMENFYDVPVTGIGFGVPSDTSLARVETGFLGLPTGASVEKGFMPAAVLEETGLVGAILVIVLLWSLLMPVIRTGALTLFWMALVALLINFGEAVFFSIGGTGFFVWVVLAFAYVHSLPAPAPTPRQPVRT